MAFKVLYVPLKKVVDRLKDGRETDREAFKGKAPRPIANRVDVAANSNERFPIRNVRRN